MSETVHYTGRIKEINLGDLTASEKLLILKGRGFDVEDDGDGDWFCDDLHINMSHIYEILEKESHAADGNIMDAKAEEDGSIFFNLRYYNGGCGFDEALDRAIKRMDK